MLVACHCAGESRVHHAVVVSGFSQGAKVRPVNEGKKKSENATERYYSYKKEARFAMIVAPRGEDYRKRGNDRRSDCCCSAPCLLLIRLPKEPFSKVLPSFG